MRQFEQLLFSIEEFSDTSFNSMNQLQRRGEGFKFGFKDVCAQAELTKSNGRTFKKCVNSAMPLDFIYEKGSNSYRLDVYDTDEKLLAKV